MHKTILIPTDFSVESLSLLKAAVLEHQESKINILLVYGYNTPGSITELLFYSPSKIISKLSTPDFREAVAVLQNRLSSRIVSLKVLIFTGKTNESFRSFLKQNSIDEVVVPAKNMLDLSSSSAMDMIPFLERSNQEKIYVEWEAKVVHPEDDKLAALFAL